MRFKLLQIFLLILSSFVGGVTAQAFDVAALAISITSVLFPTNANPGTGAMWTGVGTGNPQAWNFSDRMFVGNGAYNIPAARSNTNTTWLSSSIIGAQWIPRDAQFMSMSTVGGTAVGAGTRASDGDSVTTPPSPIGVSSVAINDSTVDHGAWAFYGEVQNEPTIGVNNPVFGMELDCKNKTSINPLTDPYSFKQGCYGLALGAGGDQTYGGASINPSNTAIFINKNSNTWNAGIVFSSTSLSDYHAINFALPHRLTWYSATTVEAAQVMAGAGSPAGVLSCTGRCLYIRTDGAAGSTLYVNETGGGISGWAAK